MTEHRRTHRRALCSSVIALILLLLMAAMASPAWASSSEEQKGAALLQQLQSGRSACAQLNASEFALVGEYLMARMVGSASAHEAMDRQMTEVLGGEGESRAHTYMGERFSGCARGAAPAAFGAMWEMMGTGMMGGRYGAYGAGGYMMGRGYGGGMMGYPYLTGDHDMGAGAIVGTVLGSLIILGLIAGIAYVAGQRRAAPRQAP